MCLKRKHPSKKAARRANAKAGFSLRSYWCAECRAWHVTNRGKR